MKNKRKLFRIIPLFLALIISASLTSCAYSSSLSEPALKKEENGYEKLELIDQLFSTYSLFDLDEEALMEAVLKGYVAGTGDKYAEYFTEEEYEQFTSDNKGESVGIGISVVQSADGNGIDVINVMPDSPALEAGLIPGDVITYIGIGENKQSVESLGYTKALDMMRGEEGTIAEFTVYRENDGAVEQIEYSVTRKKIVSVSVTSHACETDQSVGIVKITQFNLTTPLQFSSAVDDLLAKGCDKFVFDVRYNPGGDLVSIKSVLSYFLNEDDVFIRIADKKGNVETDKIEVKSYTGNYKDCSIKKSDIGKYRDLKFAVLANGSTASAAELFTSALKDYGLSVTVGTTTYGKGTMQTTYSLAPYGYGGALKLTTRYYYPPISDSYDGIGIIPNRTVALDEALEGKNIYTIKDAEDNQLMAAIEELYKK